MFTPIFSSDTDGADPAATSYGLILPSAGFNTTENVRQSVIPVAGTISQLGCILVTAPGVGKSWTFTLRVNEADTALTFTVSGASTSGSDMVNTVAVSPGDRVDIKSVPTGSPTAHATAVWTAMFEGTTSGESLTLAGMFANASNAATTYGRIDGYGVMDATEGNVQQVMPTGGTFSHFYVDMNGSPGAGKNYALTFRKNGIDQTLTATVADAATTANDTSNSVAVVAGDLVSMKVVPSGTPTARRIRWGCKWTPTIDGESVNMLTHQTAPSTAAQTFNYVTGAGSWSTTESSVRACLAMACKIRKLYVSLSVAPGAAKSWDLSLRQNLGATALTVNVAGAATTTGNNVADEITIADNDLIAYSASPNSTPASSIVRMGTVAFIDPATAVIKDLVGLGIIPFNR